MATWHDLLHPVADLRRWKIRATLGETTLECDADELAAQPVFDIGLRIEWRAGLRWVRSGAARIEVLASGTFAQSFLNLIERESIPAPALEIVLEAGASPTQSVLLFAGRVARWRREAGLLTLEANASVAWDGPALVCRDLSTLDEGRAAGLAAGAWLPQVFGAATALEGLAAFVPRTTRLAVAMGVTNTTATLVTPAEGWPPSGSVQVADEVFTYGRISADGLTLQLLVRPTPRSHLARATVALMPVGGPTWFFADHPATVTHPRTAPDAEPITAAASTIALSGRTATRVTLPQFPLLIEYSKLAKEWRAPSDVDAWQVQDWSTAEDAWMAFLGPEAARGARFSDLARLIEADWLVDLSGGELRNAKVEGVALRFAISARASWPNTAMLRVTVERGSASATRDVAKYSYLLAERMAVRGTARLDDPTLLARGTGDPLPPLELQVTGDGDLLLPPREFDLDVSALLDTADAWAFFAPPTGTPLRVRFEIVGDTTSEFALQLNDVRWVVTLREVTSERLATRLFADVVGRLSQADGMCDPAAVVRELLVHEDFAGLAEASFPSAGFTAASAIMTARGRRFRAVLRAGLGLSDVIDQALAEGALHPVRQLLSHTVRVLDDPARSMDRKPLSSSDVFEGTERLDGRPANLMAARVTLAREDDGSILARHDRVDGFGAATWPLRWLAAGGQSLVAAAFEYVGVRSSVRQVAASPGLSDRVLLDAVALPDAGTTRRGMVVGLGFGAEGFALSVEVEPRSHVLWSEGPAEILREESPARLSIWLHGRRVAAWSRGRLTIEGVARTGIALGIGSDGIAYDEAGERVLFAVSHATTRRGFAIDDQGNLEVEGDIRSAVAPGVASSSGSVAVVGEQIVFETDELGRVGVLDASSGSLSIAGELREGVFP